MASKIVEEYGDERAAEAFEQGIEQGAHKKAIEDATNMLKKKYPVEDIADITGLSVEKVLELQQQLPE